ncbi:mitochondrial ribosomal death-associated protein 3-domain-containing protein [Scheffersomyces amazonensis]|uniref:mitochondrial ribosomal death-associated protein 3-domain-containing protein n=1 Tax=Scheffersomyces amazonensis TaxID=1078765 RepID=UPI00315DD4CB
MLKAAGGNLPKNVTMTMSMRSLSMSSPTLYAKPVGTPGGKKKMLFNPKTMKNALPGQSETKVKKAGMTHLDFDDAIRSMKFYKNGTDLKPLGLSTLNPNNLSESKSTVVKYTSKCQRTLGYLGGIKKFQNNELYRHPVTLVTENTTRINEEFISKLDNSSSKENRLALIGSRGVGKSTVLAQAHALALEKFEKDVIILHINLGEQIVNGTNDYVFNPKLNKYHQPMFTKRLIHKLRLSNEEIFRKLKLSKDYTFSNRRQEFNLKKGENTLYDFLKNNKDFGKFGPNDAFQTFLEELLIQSETVPVIFSIDNVNAILDFPITKYRKPDFSPIRIEELEIGSFILDFLSGEKSFNKGGILIAKTGIIGTAEKTLDVALGIEENDPYAKSEIFDYDICVKLRENGGIKPFKIENFTKDETKQLMNFWRIIGSLPVKQFYTKEVDKTSEELSAEGGNEQFDLEIQFERMVNNNYTISSGNPHYLFKTSMLSY